jgi:putative ATP-dependent endonuclease of OLD family
MKIRRLTVRRFRGIEELEFLPSSRNVLVGTNNAGKSTILEALDLALHSGLGRPRPSPSEVDYYDRDPSTGFLIEVVIGELSRELLADAAEGLEGWRAETHEVVPEVDGPGLEACLRLRVRGTSDLDFVHEFAKDEIEGQRFGPRLRSHFGWVFDGRTRDPSRQLAFYQGGLLDRLFTGVDLDPALQLLRDALAAGATGLNTDAAVAGVLATLTTEVEPLGLRPGGPPSLEAGSVSNRELLQSLWLAMPGPGTRAIPLGRSGRGAQRLVLLAILLHLARRGGDHPIIGGFEEPEEAVEPLRQLQAARMLRAIADTGGQVFVSTHSADIVRAFDSEDIVVVERSPGVTARRLALTSTGRHGYERRLDMPLVRGLFLRHPVVVEGVSDRVVFTVFWDALAGAGTVPPAEQLGLEAISAEGISHMPMVARVLNEMGKRPVALVEMDSATESAKVLACSPWCGLVVYPPDATAHNLERLLATVVPLAALATGMSAVAGDRGDDWDAQRADLVRRCGDVVTNRAARDGIARSASIEDALGAPPEGEARQLVARCLGAKEAPASFEIKGGRSARVFAEAIVEAAGVPAPFAAALTNLARWVATGSTPGFRHDIPVP